MKDRTSKEPQPEPVAPAEPAPPMPTEIRSGDSVETDAAGNVVAVNGKPVEVSA